MSKTFASGTEALQFIFDEFVGRFGYSAEGRCDPEDTRRAIAVLEGETGPRINRDTAKDE